MMPQPEICHRPIDPDLLDALLRRGLTPLQARIAAARLTAEDPFDAILQPRLRALQPLEHLHGSDTAARLLADALERGERIALASDYDADGVTSAWVVQTAMQRHFGVIPAQLKIFLNARAHGYGLNDTLVDQILAEHGRTPFGVVMTADQGSSDEARIRRLRDAGITVIVTDHHQLPEAGVPASAHCVVNPQQEACRYDTTVAGCTVAFLVMNQLRRELIARGHLPEDAPSLKDLLGPVALGTIADSVSLKSPNNRAIVQAGLQQINTPGNPVWDAVRQFTRTRSWMDAEFLAFEVATRINAASRINDVELALAFLSATTPEEALAAFKRLDEDNRNRKAAQQSLLEQGKIQAQAQAEAGKYSLTLCLQGQPGMQGIVAQRMGEAWGRPTVAFTDLEDGTLAGSGRTIVETLDLKELFESMALQAPDLFISQGGHAGAAGCMIHKNKLDTFAELLEERVREALNHQAPTLRLWSDGSLAEHGLYPGVLREINVLAPYGQGWPAPLFDDVFEVVNARTVGADKTHISAQVRSSDGRVHNAIWFNGQPHGGETCHLCPGMKIHAVYRPTLSSFAGRQQFQLRIQHGRTL
ncbi:exonuclease RecJ [Sulfurivirga caldicuralii]|uniref:Single-stranded-DNA-specific exonuclease RecJ n=1 Tax=Sulfurivirga caldicuralii TaxID=364032 RepID=A0A1N6FFK9_9GAMM|nr:DHH family phosphoesterase [Sulfurivirga caldicuralii]SIN93994.1 exonuclease RecJ [Sulfurivirga caldicuralii]